MFAGKFVEIYFIWGQQLYVQLAEPNIVKHIKILNVMTENDVMIGDWVFNEVPCYVTAIYPNGTMDCQGDDLAISTDRVDHIPLTKEILKKNGFEKMDGEYQKVFYHYEGLDLVTYDRLWNRVATHLMWFLDFK